MSDSMIRYYFWSYLRLGVEVWRHELDDVINVGRHDCTKQQP
jgi:hypothetical protein